MKLMLSEWASVAEIVSGIAVVVTLIFLTVGIKENTAVTRASVYDSLLDNIDEIQLLAIQDAEISRIAGTLLTQETEGLDEADRARLQIFVRALFLAYERMYFGREYGVIGNAEWVRFERSICLQTRRAEFSG